MDYSNIIKSLHDPEFHPRKSGKDLSHRKVFTMNAGELLPVLFEEAVPGDYFEFDVASLIRTFPLQTAAFLRAKVHFDFFFVPATAVWRNYDKFISQRDDNFTSYSRGFAYEPNIRLQDLVYYINSGATGTATDSVYSRAKLASLFGYGDWFNVPNNAFNSGGPFYDIKDKSLTAMPFYVYNRIFNLIYRDSWKDIPLAADVASMSADNLDCSTYNGSLVDYAGTYNPAVQKLVNMHYHRFEQDLFMGLLPSQQFGSVSTVDLMGSTGSDYGKWTSTPSNQWTQNTPVYSLFSTAQSFKLQDGVNNPTIGHTHDLSGGSFDVLALRKAQAMQKWKEYNERAGWKAGKQIKAMFGENQSLDIKHDIDFIDSYQFPLMIDEVMQTSPSAAITGISSSPSPVGELAGKGIGIGNGHKIKYHVGNRYGYFVCIAYILPQSEYDATGIDKMLVRSQPFDHYTPALDNLGLEPVFKFELNAQGATNVFDNVIGYAPRYHEYKTRVDKVYGEFANMRSLSSWVAARRDVQNAANSGSIPVSLLYVTPYILDSVFYTAAATSDQFIVNCNFKVDAVRPMSDLGLPSM